MAGFVLGNLTESTPGRRVITMTIQTKLKTLLRRTRAFFTPDHNRFLWHVTGVIHVGANSGEERDLYAAHGLDVVWVEPIPEVFEEVASRIAAFPKQLAIQGLTPESDDQKYVFHVANNDGGTSSMLELKHRKNLWPDVRFEKTITLRSQPLPTLLSLHQVDCRNYQALVLDTQGAELLVLKAASGLLPAFSYIKTEVADFEQAGDG
jgi:FkbM family methyltransferase